MLKKSYDGVVRSQKYRDLLDSHTEFLRGKGGMFLHELDSLFPSQLVRLKRMLIHTYFLIRTAVVSLQCPDLLRQLELAPSYELKEGNRIERRENSRASRSLGSGSGKKQRTERVCLRTLTRLTGLSTDGDLCASM